MNNLGCVKEKDFEAVVNDPSLERDYYKRKIIPNIEIMSEKLKNTLQESSDISNNFFNLFDYQLFKANFDQLPEVINLYSKL